MVQQMAQQRMSEEAHRLGETYQLGKPTATYHVQYSRANVLFFWSQIAMVGVTVAVGIGFIVAPLIFKVHIPVTLFLPIILGLNALNISNIARQSRYKKQSTPITYYDPFTRNLRVYVYPKGLIRLRSTKPEVVYWDNIKRVRYIRPSSLYGRGFQPSITVIRRHGKSLSFGGNIANIAVLGETIEQEYLKRKEH